MPTVQARPKYDTHQLRFLSNTVLAALASRPLTDTRPDNPDHRFRITSSPVPRVDAGTTIEETRRFIAISPAHTGLNLPLTGILITLAQLQTWAASAPKREAHALDRAISLTWQARNAGDPPPLLWHPVGHSSNGWYCRPNPSMPAAARAASLDLLTLAQLAGNVKPVGADEPKLLVNS